MRCGPLISPPGSLLIVLILCVSVFLQILGVPIAFYNLDGANSLVESDSLEDFSITTESINPLPVWLSKIAGISLDRFSPHSFSVLIFHPPIFPV
jgi:hypothetical protein